MQKRGVSTVPNAIGPWIFVSVAAPLKEAAQEPSQPGLAAQLLMQREMLGNF
jgi:hypothetical protein